jgi:LPS-assembly lipoprotein
MSKRFAALVIIGAMTQALSACGFRPLYATESTPAGIAVYFNEIFVEDIPARTGLILRNQLMDAFTPGGTPAASAYRLVVVLEEKREGLAIQENADITRYNYTLIARFELRDALKSETLHRGSSRAIAGYNVLKSQFTTVIAQRDAEERAAREVGEDIRLRLGVFFEKRFGLTGPQADAQE